MPDKIINEPAPTVTKMDKPVVTDTSDAPAADEMVKVKSSSLTRILERLDTQDKEIAVLRQSVNQGRLTEAENATKPKELPKAYLKVYQGKIVIGWKNEKAETFTHPSNPNVPVGEILKMSCTFFDGLKSDIFDQVDFTRNEDRVEVSVVDGIDALRNSNLPTVRVKFEKLICSPGDTELKEKFVIPTDIYEVHKNFLNP